MVSILVLDKYTGQFSGLKFESRKQILTDVVNLLAKERKSMEGFVILDWKICERIWKVIESFPKGFSKVTEGFLKEFREVIEVFVKGLEKLLKDFLFLRI